MDVVFGTGTNNEPDWMTRVKGINGLRDYLKQDAVVKPIETIIVEGITEKELEKFDEAVSKYIVSEYNGMMPIAEYSIKGNPIMLSLAIKEYKITDKILDSIDNLTIRKCGRIAHNRNDGFSSIYSSGIYKNNEFSILNFLYLPSFIAEEKIRSRIIGRLADEADDLYDFSFEQTKTFNNDEVKQQLIADKKKHPKLFERKKVCYAYDMSSLFFLLQVFSDDDYVNQLLANNFVGLYSINDPQINQEVVVTEDMLILGKIVKRLQNQIDTHKELLCFMLKLVTELRRRNLLDNYSKKCWIDAEKTVWDNLMKLSVAEADLYALESDTNNKDYRAELIYEYAYSSNDLIFCSLKYK